MTRACRSWRVADKSVGRVEVTAVGATFTASASLIASASVRRAADEPDQEPTDHRARRSLPGDLRQALNLIKADPVRTNLAQLGSEERGSTAKV